MQADHDVHACWNYNENSNMTMIMNALPPVPPSSSIGAGPTMGRLFVYLSQSMTCSAQQFSLNTAKSDSCSGVGGILVIRPAPSPVVINALSKGIVCGYTL